MNGPDVEVLNNDKLIGASVADWYQFAPSGIVQLDRRPETPMHASQIIARAESQLGKPYDLLAQNCEHFASWAYTGSPASKQLLTVALEGLGALALTVAFSDSH